MSEPEPKLSASKLRAAWLVALDELTRAKIAAEVGISEWTLYEWLRLPEFQAEVRRGHQRLARELVGPALRRLRKTITTGKPAEANRAIELVLKAADMVGGAADDGGDSQSDDDGAPGRFVVVDPGPDG